MSLAFDHCRSTMPVNRWGQLPRRMRVLFVNAEPRATQWLTEALAADSAVEVQLGEAHDAHEGLERLREVRFDAVLVNHIPARFDALEFVEAMRQGGADEPVIILGLASEAELAPLAYEVGADGYLCIGQTTTRLLLWELARAWEHRTLIHDNRRLALAEQQRLQTEHRAAERLLDEQRSLLRDLESLAPSAEVRLAPAPGEPTRRIHDDLVAHYRELLRAYVMMGQGNLGAQMTQLADWLAGTHLSTGDVMQLHLHVVEELIEGLGSRSARHVLARADLLILEVMVHLGECYRQLRGA